MSDSKLSKDDTILLNLYIESDAKSTQKNEKDEDCNL